MEIMCTERENEQFEPATVCDVEQGIRNMGNNPDLFRKHFNKFKDNCSEILMQLNNHIERKDYKNASILCHSIKGLSGMLGLTTLHVHMKESEFLFRDLAQQSGDSVDAATLLCEKMQKLTLQLATDIVQVCAVVI